MPIYVFEHFQQLGGLMNRMGLNMDFSKIADDYTPIVQLSAGEKLLELLKHSRA